MVQKIFFDKVLSRLGSGSGSIFRELYLDSDMKHGLDPTCIGSACPTYVTEFGTGLTTEAAAQTYIVKRAATFFQAILIGIQSTLMGVPVRKEFVDCENSRGGAQVCSNDCHVAGTCTPDCP